ncbi:siphovirus Gp157 family protein [Sulfurimonas sediminis]|uniref:Siphovirus Gp157 family protein n=1 Tax=Sulfurimonas sediminis TaxID=2590020 RepID=A0A7M1AYG1_9BACT|nr:siphovirus Gp157 family protein [Sulfurimonas sediminis]QOP42484.1 siphovirus Gp157 family protein [Sulfurimonas sediminis]
MKLIDIASEFQAIYEMASDTDDIETITKLYNELNEDLEVKADSVRVVLAKLKSDSDYLTSEIKRLQERKKSIEKNAENLKSLLMWTLQKVGIPKLKTAKATFYFATSKSLQVSDEVKLSSLPDEYIQIEYKTNKKALKEAIEAGKEIPGVTIVENETLRIR